MPVRAILEESALDTQMKEWNELDLAWDELALLPIRHKARLSEWRAIYYIFDESNRKGYVGSAYGTENLLGRWLNYAATGHGGNRLLRQRDPKNFRFSILQRVSPDLPSDEVIRLEARRATRTCRIGLVIVSCWRNWGCGNDHNVIIGRRI